MAAAQCPACTAPVTAGDAFCEACGHDLSQPAPAVAAPVPAAGEWVSSSGPPATCPGCGGSAFSADGYCDTCGQRRANGKDHSELQLGGLAAVTDKGRRHHRN